MEQSGDWYERLTPKEREVLEAYAREHSYKGVARALGKSANVVDQQLLRARRKMGVSSMAEAMYLLAKRQSPLLDECPQPVAEDDLPTRQARRNPLRLILLVAQTIVVVFLGIGLIAHKSTALVRPTVLSPEAIASNIVALRSNHSERADQLRAEAVGGLCEIAWTRMWGAQEESLRDIISDLAPDIHASFDWALVHDPDLALKIIANGHRLFSRVPALADWARMVDRALARVPPTWKVDYGRALCAVAYAHWSDRSGRAQAAATEAVRLFENMPAHQWDLANAMRHYGLSCRGSPEDRLTWYSRALLIYRRLHDKRGEAMTLLSIAQAGYRPGDTKAIENRILAALEAAAEFGQLKNRTMRNEAIEELIMNEDAMPYKSPFDGLRRQTRAEYWATSEDLLGLNDPRGAIEFLGRCFKMDIILGDQASQLQDIDRILANPRHISIWPPGASKLLGYSDHIRLVLTRGHNYEVDYWRKAEPEAYRQGAMMSPAEAVSVAKSLLDHP